MYPHVISVFARKLFFAPCQMIFLAGNPKNGGFPAGLQRRDPCCGGRGQIAVAVTGAGGGRLLLIDIIILGYTICVHF